MKELKFENKALQNGSFSNEKYSIIMSIASTFVGCKFEGIRANNICFGAGENESLYESCSFDNSIFSASVLGLARFVDCTFKNVKIKEIFSVNGSFINCSFSGEIGKGSFNGKFQDLDGTIYENDFYGNDFSEANLIDVGFSNINLFEQKFPDESRFRIISDLGEFIDQRKKELVSIDDPNLKKEVEKTISIIAVDSKGGNYQYFMDSGCFPKKLVNAAKWLFREDSH